MTPAIRRHDHGSFIQRRIELPGIGLHYAERPGSGPPMILLHGIGMDWRVWQGLARRLAPHFHLYLPDLRGHGSSDKPSHGYTLAGYAADIEDLVDSLGLTGVTLVGSSLGGTVALAVEAPVDVVAFRVLIDPPMTGGPVRDPAMFQEIRRARDAGEEELRRVLQRWNPSLGTFTVGTMAEMWTQASPGVIDDMLARSESYFDLTAALRANESPTLLVQADPARGGVLSDVLAERALTGLRNGELLSFPGAGHAVHAYAPDALTDAILRSARRAGVPLRE